MSDSNVIPLNIKKPGDEYKFIMSIQKSQLDGGERQTLYCHTSTGMGLLIVERGDVAVKIVLAPEMLQIIKLRF